MMGKINLDKLKSFDPIRPERQADVKGGQTPPILPPSTKAAGEDRVDLSGRAAEVGKLVAHVKELPDVRQEKVANVRAQVASGHFDPTGTEIADAIIKDEFGS
jgi:flagellar biosynthesis anti-sigma factor FlgM